jgi:LysM repeat protein
MRRAVVPVEALTAPVATATIAPACAVRFQCGWEIVSSAIHSLQLLALALILAACSLPQPPAPATPLATAQAVLEITPAPTQDVDATATAYARALAATPTPAGLYVVQPGDTLGALAQDFGSTVDEIMAANGLTDPNALQVGQPLIIPSLVQSSPALDATPTLTATLTPTLRATATITATGTVTVTPTLATP